MKQCSKCQKHKEATDFHKNGCTPDGLNHICKLCRKNYAKYWYQARYIKKSQIPNLTQDKQLYYREYHRKRRQTDINYKLLYNLRIRLRSALKQNAKTGTTLQFLGCSIDKFKTHLESKFQPGMTWENYGYKGWHLDHIRPLSSFDLTDTEQLRHAAHYTNIQPLWAIDNLKKGAKRC